MREYGFIYKGHGIGMNIQEPPIINDTNDALIERVMALAIEVNMFNELPLSKTTITLKNEGNILLRKLERKECQ